MADEGVNDPVDSDDDTLNLDLGTYDVATCYHLSTLYWATVDFTPADSSRPRASISYRHNYAPPLNLSFDPDWEAWQRLSGYLEKNGSAMRGRLAQHLGEVVSKVLEKQPK